MDSYRYPADLDKNQAQVVLNMQYMDSGRAVTRPGADQLDSIPSTFSGINPSGTVQGLAFLDNFTNGQFLLMGQGGKLYTWNGAQWSNPLAFVLTSSNSSFVAVQGIDQLLISDGVQGMRVWDGITFHPTSTGPNDNTATNGPSGVTIMAFIAGMFVCAGPAMVQGTGGGVQNYPADTLVFSNYVSAAGGWSPEGGWSNTQSFRVGNGDGDPIVGLAVLQATQATSPQYSLAVLKANSIWVVNIAPGSFPGTGGGYFANMFAQFVATPQGDQAGLNVGLVGSKAFCLFQNDLLFMSQDGVQSLQRMEAAAGQYQLTAPLSLPIQTYIDRINWQMAFNIQCVKYRQLAIWFVPLDSSTTNNYALVWNGRIGKWAVWTGWTPEAVCVTRFNNVINLVLGNSDGTVNVWKDAQDLTGLDNTYKDNGVPINWSITTRSFTFGSLDNLKKGKAVLLRFNQGNASINFQAFLDAADSDDWNQSITPGGAVLPVLLPFVLASAKPVQVYRDLEGLPYFNELWFTIGATSGWADIRGLVASAYMKPITDPAA